MLQYIRSRFYKQRKHARPLDSLPVELLLQIADYLAPSLRDMKLRDMNAFLRTTRVPHHVLIPVLHRHALKEADDYGRSIIRSAAARGNVAAAQSRVLWR